MIIFQEAKVFKENITESYREIWDKYTPIGKYTIGIPFLIIFTAIVIIMLPFIIAAAIFPEETNRTVTATWNFFDSIFLNIKCIFIKEEK